LFEVIIRRVKVIVSTKAVTAQKQKAPPVVTAKLWRP
jgi:hypothetical protein